MLRILKLSNFQVGYDDFEGNRDYNIRISFVPDLDNPDEAKFGFQYGLILYPHTFGVADTTINDKDYDCCIMFDDEKPSVPDNQFPFFSYLVKKIKKDIKEIPASEPAKPTQVMGESMGSEFRTIKGPTGDTAVNLGKNSVEIVAGENRIVISDKGIQIYGKTDEYKLPTNSVGGLFEQSGFMQLIPDVPPFGQIKYLPSSRMLQKASSIISVVRKFSEASNV
jgi:hypothetical protein